ncbi:hypothetical protein [Streptomyces phaeoluteigriseus]|uniref:hypothetical protein n=1 Tax=Streptomyces phaeoluteigriseus TaxID=114686 RepID=UPI001B865AA1|nr:hypothetical protein [Streptomyces phaeoluteigriseus]
MDDTASGKLQIYSVEEKDPKGATCIVRCVGGRVRAGQRFEVDRDVDATADTPPLMLDRINRYERLVDFIGPPHSAQVHLSGEGVATLTRGCILSSVAPPLTVGMLIAAEDAYLTDSRDALRIMILDIKAGKADHLL